jgi:phosphoribosyl 1,2-cyclic phosphodiesterase
VLTDVGESTPHICAMLSGCDGLVLEFNHDAELLAGSAYPASVKRRIAGRFGHLENGAAAALLREIDCSQLQHLVAAHRAQQSAGTGAGWNGLAGNRGDARSRVRLA